MPESADMGTEIERKFLVVDECWRSAVEAEQRLRQGYLCAGPAGSVRIRITDGEATLTLKGPTRGIRRAEFEYPIPLADAEAMFAEMVAGPCIDKVRYQVRWGGHLWDLDLFLGDNAGLVVAEIELVDEDEAFERPPWAGEEVSEDLRYHNSYLVRHPYKDW
jgi:adenylate cyclase